MDARVSKDRLGRLVEWPEIMMELRRYGWYPKRVADYLNVPRTTANGWANDRYTPNGDDALWLLTLYYRVCKSRTFSLREMLETESRPRP